MNQKLQSSVTLRRMPDGSFRISGLGRGGQVHLRKAMRAWVMQEDAHTGAAHYVSWSRQEAETYAASHGLSILEPCQS